MNTAGSFGNSPMQGDEMDQSQYNTSGVGQDAYSNPSQGSFTGGNQGQMRGSAGERYDTGIGSVNKAGFGASPDSRRGGFQGVYGDDSQCTFGGQGCTSGYDQTGRGGRGMRDQSTNLGYGGASTGTGYTDYNQGYGSGAPMQSAYGPQSGAGQAYGGNQPQQQKGGFVNTAKTLYKDYKKEKSGGSQDNQGRGGMGN